MASWASPVNFPGLRMQPGDDQCSQVCSLSWGQPGAFCLPDDFWGLPTLRWPQPPPNRLLTSVSSWGQPIGTLYIPLSFLFPNANKYILLGGGWSWLRCIVMELEPGSNTHPKGSSLWHSEQVAGPLPSCNEYKSQPSKHTFNMKLQRLLKLFCWLQHLIRGQFTKYDIKSNNAGTTGVSEIE